MAIVVCIWFAFGTFQTIIRNSRGFSLKVGNRRHFFQKQTCTFVTKNNKQEIMTQILVTLNEDVTTQHVRKAIELLRGVVSTMVFKTKAETNRKTLRQQEYVKDSLTRAFDELKRAQRGEHKMMTDEEFMAELKAEGIA